ncbi:FoF1 ATP synthase subunit delta/epsilon [Desulfurobacterium atlanticum]|uniref:ATP synthase epsilon chain n=1 Tax=Desulfurobacterium atlanticum TaxID=240169 RepID=A0A238YKR1_9BACT|nr:F0F1 ATP synthase subunit epsilon [Desulfurobacterium atlanticum]SNR71214.1 F-type H+-transporting ATPase subunit epsilon [Desulfurobacterium atlanticum]
MAVKKGLHTVDLKIASLTGKHFGGKAKEVYVDMDDSMIGVLPAHQPEFYKFNAASVSFINENGEEEKYYVYDGFLEIEQDQVLVAVKDIYKPGEITVDEVKEEIKSMEKEIESLPEEEVDKKRKLEEELEKKKVLLQKLMFS